MIFLSNLLRQQVYDNNDHRVGILYDVYVTLNETFPIVTGLVIHSRTGNHQAIIVPWSQVQTIEETPVHLSVKQSQLVPYQ
ncbi:MAG: PRC-barrel domain-containing protein, partial [Ktedonobacteraceae bacterium]|nr:PRC-barrel domain-containing protein [Ktedonobacteraceae bacterium]